MRASSSQVPAVGPPDVPVEVGTGTSPALALRPVELSPPTRVPGTFVDEPNPLSEWIVDWLVDVWVAFDDPEEPGPPAAFCELPLYTEPLVPCEPLGPPPPVPPEPLEAPCPADDPLRLRGAASARPLSSGIW